MSTMLEHLLEQLKPEVALAQIKVSREALGTRGFATMADAICTSHTLLFKILNLPVTTFTLVLGLIQLLHSDL